MRSDSGEKNSWQSRFRDRPICCLPGPVLGAANASGSSILEPAAGALLGQYYGAGNMAQNTAKLGRTPPVHLTYYAWTDDWTGTVTKADLAAGRIPLVNWEPHKIDFNKIVDGSLDATIVARAKGSKALGKKFFLDFAAEMNGDEAWGATMRLCTLPLIDIFTISSLLRARPTWSGRGVQTSRISTEVTRIRWTTTQAMPTSIGPGSMGTTGVRQTVAGRPSNRFSGKSTPSLQPRKSRS